MAFVRLLEDYGDNQAGELVSLPATVARSLVHNGKAVDGADIHKYTPKRETATVDYERRGLPEDFPERERLEKAGYDSIEKVRKTSDSELLDVKYIGKKTLKDIREAT